MKKLISLLLITSLVISLCSLGVFANSQVVEFVDDFSEFDGVTNLDAVDKVDDYLKTVDGVSTVYKIGKKSKNGSEETAAKAYFYNGTLVIQGDSTKKSIGVYANTGKDFGSAYTASVTSKLDLLNNAGGIREFTIGRYLLNTNRGAKNFAFRVDGVDKATESFASEHITDGGKIKFTITVIGKKVSYSIEDVADNGTLTTIWSGTYTDETATPLTATTEPQCVMFIQNHDYSSAWDDLSIKSLTADPVVKNGNDVYVFDAAAYGVTADADIYNAYFNDNDVLDNCIIKSFTDFGAGILGYSVDADASADSITSFIWDSNYTPLFGPVNIK